MRLTMGYKVLSDVSLHHHHHHHHLLNQGDKETAAISWYKYPKISTTAAKIAYGVLPGEKKSRAAE